MSNPFDRYNDDRLLDWEQRANRLGRIRPCDDRRSGLRHWDSDLSIHESMVQPVDLGWTIPTGIRHDRSDCK